MRNLKQAFIYNEIWLLAFGGAFQRAGIYKENISDAQKAKFRKYLKSFILEHVLPQYKSKVVEMAHILNIEAVKVSSEKYSHILTYGKLNIGISQKLLNLVLKYYWCLSEIAMPPHCPLDRIIQQKGLKSKIIINWTNLDDMDEYLRIMHQIKQVAEAEGKSIAEWELETFERSNV